MNNLFLSPVESSPTSFDGKFGRTVYRLTSVIETPRFSKDYNAVKPFYLLKPLDLNEVPDIEVVIISVDTLYQH